MTPPSRPSAAPGGVPLLLVALALASCPRAAPAQSGGYGGALQLNPTLSPSGPYTSQQQVTIVGSMMGTGGDTPGVATYTIKVQGGNESKPEGVAYMQNKDNPAQWDFKQQIQLPGVGTMGVSVTITVYVVDANGTKYFKAIPITVNP